MLTCDQAAGKVMDFPWTSVSVSSSMLCHSLSLHTSTPGQFKQLANQSFASMGRSSQNTGLTMSALLIALLWLPVC